MNLKAIGQWIGWGSPALGVDSGVPSHPSEWLRNVPERPAAAEVPQRDATPERALALSAVYRAVDVLTTTIASLPLMVYRNNDGNRDIDRGDPLWMLLHDSPNEWMTPSEFWTVVLLNRFFRGNGYARIVRNEANEAIALWPMSADAVEPVILRTGRLAYRYRAGGEEVDLRPDEVLHIKGLGNGIQGLSPLHLMRSTTTLAQLAEEQSSRIYANADKPAGILTTERVLNAEQRAAVKQNFATMAEGGSSRLHVLEAAFKFQPVTISPADAQLLETRRFSVEEISRWFGVPAVLLNHANVTTWGSGISELMRGFYTLTIRPALVAIEQAITKRVLTPRQQARFTVEWSIEGLLRSDAKTRFDLYASATQNGVMTRNECRQLENLPAMEGGDTLTAQTNLVPIDKLGQAQPQGGGDAATQGAIAQ